MTELQSKLTGTQNELKQKKEELDTVNRELEELIEEKAELEKSNSCLREKVRYFKSVFPLLVVIKSTTLRFSRVELSVLNNMHFFQVESLETDVATQIDKNEFNVSSLKDAKEEINKLQSDLDTTKIELDTAERLKEEANGALAVISEKLDTANSEKEKLTAQLCELETEMTKLQNEQVG